MKRNKFTFLLGFLLFSHNLFAQLPGGIVKPAVWLKGNFSSDLKRLAWINYNPAVALDKNDGSFKLPVNIESLRRVTVFTVYRDSITNKENEIWEVTGEFGDLLLSANHVSSKSKNLNVAFKKNKPAASNKKTEAIIHSYSGSTIEGSASTNVEYKETSIRFGNSATSASSDRSLKLIAEFILYKKLLDEVEITKVETYLALKYGIALENNYLSAKGKTVWNWENDKRFSNNIAGIGRDDQSSLLQKQSSSITSNEQLVIGANKIVDSNAENTGQINDGDYLIWGDNGDEFVGSNSFAAANEILLSEKKWLMMVSGGSSNKIPTELKIDTKTFIPGKFPARNFYLVVDRSGSADFRPENCLYIHPDTISGDGIATFKNIFWDTDLSGKDNFTFGFKHDLSARLSSNGNGQNPVKANPNMKQGSMLTFNVFPNPISDGNYQVAIQFDKPTDIVINLYDLSQQLVYSKELSGQDIYQFSDHINGKPSAYILQLMTPQEEYYRMIILQ